MKRYLDWKTSGSNSIKKFLSNGSSNTNNNSNSQGGKSTNNPNSGSVSSAVKRRKLRKLSLSSWEQSNSVELLLYTNPLMVKS